MGSRGAAGSQLSGGRSESGQRSRRMTKPKEIYCASSGRATAMSELLEESQDERDEQLRQTEAEDQNDENEGQHQAGIETSQAIRNPRLVPSSNLRRSSPTTNHCHANSHHHAPTCSHGSHSVEAETPNYTLLQNHRMHQSSHQRIHRAHCQPVHKPSCSLLHAHQARGVHQAKPSRFIPTSANKDQLLLAQSSHHHQTRPLKQIPSSSHLRRSHINQPVRAVHLHRRAPEAVHQLGRDVVGATKVSPKLNLRAERGGRSSTSVKFISQLYFLIHLSAMISLLLHHKNLVSSEWRLAIRQQQQHLHSLATASGNNEQQLHYVTSTTKRSIQQPNRSPEGALPLPTDVQALPEPQMFRAASRANSSHTSQAAAAAAAAAAFGPPKIRSHIGSDEEPSQSSQQQDSRSSDILVRLVGRLHAKCALQYFLCYLLSSSITVLIFLWLIRVFTPAARTELQLMQHLAASPPANIQVSSQLEAEQKSSRQDCTPVLIGSISLGLIQLIVIGLDIADNVDWLASTSSKGADLAHKWPILLPFLQFSFVSLLMQFILAQVAKNRDSLEEVSLTPVASSSQRFSSASVARTSKRSGFEQRQRASDNAQNIALAHLLVTHILLWLMRMNSISLFQANEPQVFLVAPPPPGSFAPPFGSMHSTSSSSAADGGRRKLDLTAKDNGPSERAVGSNPSTSRPAASSSSTTTTTTSTTTTARSPPLQSVDSTTTPTSRDTFHLDLIEKDEPRLIDLRPPTTMTSPTSSPLPPLLPVQTATNKTVSQTAAANATKSERDLRAAGRHQPGLMFNKPIQEAFDSNDLGDTTKAPERKRSHYATFQRPPTTSARPSWSSSPPPPLKSIPSTTSMMPTPPSTPSTTTSTTTTTSTETPIVQTNSKPAKQAGLGVELQQPNITANLFRSSLPKRMTAFRQGRPNQRINLTSPSSSTTASEHSSTGGPTARSATSTAPPQTQRETATRPRSKHKVRVFVSRDGDYNSPNSIDLTAVIPSSALPDEHDGHNDSSDGDDDNESRNDDEPSPTTPGSRAISSTSTSTSTTKRPPQTSTSQRPFPSVNEDPAPVRFSRPHPPLTDHKAVASFAGPSRAQKVPLEVVQPKKKKAEVEKSQDTSVEVTRRKMNSPSQSGNSVVKHEEASESEPEYQDDPSSQFDDGPEEDLDASLPPPPNYDDNVASNATDASDNYQPAADELAALLASGQVSSNELQAPRRGRKLAPLEVSRNETLRQLALLDEEAFVFNEAASIAHNLTTRPPTVGENITLLQLELVGKSPLTATPSKQRRHAEWQQQQQQQQQQHQQPTFTEFLLPIVQQYHILVLTILFNMWLDSMQSGDTVGQASSVHQEDPMSTTLNSGCQDLARSRSSSLASQLSSHNSASSPDLSTRQLVTLENFELARHQGRRLRATGLSELDHDTDAFYMRNPTARSPERPSSNSSVSSTSSAALNDSNQAQLVQRQRNLFWYDKRRRSQAHQRLLMLRPGDHNRLLQADFLTATSQRARSHKQSAASSSSSACSVFFGLLVVSGSLIVILLNLDLLSLLTQCTIQLVSILVCLLGLCCMWRLRRSLNSSQQLLRAKKIAPTRRPASELLQQVVVSHKGSFHYLFLLAAYYCGLSIALNLGQQYHSARLFPQPVVKFVQRHYSSDTARQQQQHPFEANPEELELDEHPVRIINFQLLFHALLVLKGLILIVQVTVQTVLIRTSWSWPFGRCELRQLYNFLMFANLSLWALEICDQQQQMQLAKQQQYQFLVGASGQLEPSPLAEHSFELLTLDGFTRFASSVVTLSHLYHGLVFMQH